LKRRFDSHLKRNLVQIENNVYINKTDSQYMDKLAKFYKAPSPDVHMCLGSENEKAGQYEKALYHYQAAMNPRSTKSEEAWTAFQRVKAKVDQLPDNLSKKDPYLSKKMLYLLVIITASCILTITLLLLE